MLRMGAEGSARVAMVVVLRKTRVRLSRFEIYEPWWRGRRSPPEEGHQIFVVPGCGRLFVEAILVPNYWLHPWSGTGCCGTGLRFPRLRSHKRPYITSTSENIFNLL